MNGAASHLQLKKAGAKLTIKPLKSQPQLPTDFEEDSVLTKLMALWDECVNERLNALQQTAAEDPRAFLSRVAALWEAHCEQSRLVRDVFLALDRFLVARGGVSDSIHDRTLRLVAQGLLARAPLHERLLRALDDEVQRDREGEASHRALLRTLTKMFAQLGMYAPELEPRVLTRAREHYRRDSAAQLGTGTDVAGYLVAVDAQMAAEEERCAACLEASTRRPMVSVLEEELVRRHAALLVDAGAAKLLDEGRVSDLRRLYTMLARVGEVGRLRDAWAAYVRKRGTEVVQDTGRDKDMVDRLLALRAALLTALRESLASDEAFARSMKDNLESAVNSRQNRPAELLAKFLDQKLRAGVKRISDQELEKSMEDALSIFRLVQGKDVFEAFYKRHLARRLLLERSSSEDAERKMLALLKEECGAQFTNKLEGMFRDMELSRELMGLAKRAPQYLEASPSGVDISVSVLTAGHWPSYPSTTCTLPAELVRAQEAFTSFYLSKHSGRNLSWVPSQGTCTVKAQFRKGARELVVSQLQCSVLLAFSEADRLSCSEIQAQTGIEAGELKRVLQSLTCVPSMQVLLKEPKGKEVADTDVFVFNEGFTSDKFRVRLNQVQPKEVQEESQQINEGVAQDRQYQIDAAVVRIMKARKTLSHKLLISELIDQLRFTVQPADLKKRIESLIEREFLERDTNDKTVYNYLA